MSIFEIIQTELASDVGLYGGLTDQQVANELNAVDKDQNRTSMSGNEILSSIDNAALVLLTGDDAVKVMGIVGMESVDPFGPAAQIFINAFNGGSVTILALQSARVETVSRVSQIGLGNIETASLIGWVTEVRAV